MFLEGKVKHEKMKEEETLYSLAPKIITEEEQLKNIKPYLDSLKKAINTEGINNIALTGSYGSGKSTILKTFRHSHPEYKYLNISLASFKENKGKPEDTEFERKLEVSILQQMFYHVEPSIIPDSRFKRITNITQERLRKFSFFLSLWLFSVLLLFKFDYINILNPEGWKFAYRIDWIAILASAMFFVGLSFLARSIYRLFKNSKINKLNIKGELELGEITDKSVFNQHLEEILYFFERTEFNVVTIEDVDRFDSTDIFTKLREINILINNSKVIDREVKFIYAIKDEMFANQNDRVKFFEFIIPVISFINPSNANEQLRKLIEESNLKGVLSEDFIDDVIIFINDIDMRLLINIFHEYTIYREHLDKALNQNELFAMMIYKNMYPEDFGDLMKQKGKLYQFISKRKEYGKELINVLLKKGEELDNEIKLIESEVDKPIKDLRAIYILKLVGKLENFHSFEINGDSATIEEVLEDSFFDALIEEKKIKYYYWSDPHMNGRWQITGPKYSSFDFSVIEIEVSNKFKYKQREKYLTDISSGKLNQLKKGREELLNKIRDVEAFSIKDIFEQVTIDGYLDSFKDKNLVRYLLLNGYINENYNDYISLFHGVSLTQSDYNFIRNVKGYVESDFNYKLIKTEQVIKNLQEKYFAIKYILNFDLLTCLMNLTSEKHSKSRILFRYLSGDEENINQFILAYIVGGSESLGLFIKNIVKYKPSFWVYLKQKSLLPEEKIKDIVKLVFEFAEKQDIESFEDMHSLAAYIEKMPDLLSFASSLKKTDSLEYFIKSQNLLIEYLQNPESSSMPFLEYVYENNLYELNQHNIDTIVRWKAPENNRSLYPNYYSSLYRLNIEKLFAYIESNFKEFVENVLLKIGDENSEDEEILKGVLNNTDYTLELREKFVLSQRSDVESLKKIEDIQVKEMLLRNNKVKPTWLNVFDYYDSLEEQSINDILVHYFNQEKNYFELSKFKMNLDERDKSYLDDFSNLLLYTKGIEQNAFKSLLLSFQFNYNAIEYSQFNDDIINHMIEINMLNFSYENFDGIRNYHPSLFLKYIGANQDQFIEQFVEHDKFLLNNGELILFFKSDLINLNYKLEVIQNLAEDIIIGNTDIAIIVFELIYNLENISVSYGEISAMFDANLSIEKRIILLNHHFNKLKENEIETLVKKLGDDYSKIFEYDEKVLFDKNEYNRVLFKNLLEKEMITHMSLKEKNNKIRIIGKIS